MGEMQEFAASHSFEEYWPRFAHKALREEDLYDLNTLKHVGDPDETGEDRWVWKEGRRREQEFNFGPFFPIENGGEPPYFRQRGEVDRHEAGLYFEYREDGGTGDFTPFPLPTPERLKKIAEDE